MSALKNPPTKSQVPLTTFAYLFSEMVSYHQQHSSSLEILEHRLHDAGIGIGRRYLELLAFRNPKIPLRDGTLSSCMQFISTTMWKALFGRNATSLLKSDDSNQELYMLEESPITNTFICVPDSLGDVNCAAFLSGIINGALLALALECTVTASWDESHTQAVFVVRVINKND